MNANWRQFSRLEWSGTFPNDIARCPGWGDGPEEWLEECQDCQRRTALPGPNNISPPQIIALWCENYIPPQKT